MLIEKNNESLKSEIRKNIRRIRDSLSEGFVKDSSNLIADNFFSMDAVRDANIILAYYSYNNEVNTHGIIENLISMNKKIALPICKKDQADIAVSFISSKAELKPGIFGIQEPVSEMSSSVRPETIDVVIVPGIAFDRKGNRIGYGKGYYDRFLCSLSPSQLKIGLCFDFQLFDELPFDSHDVPVDCVITESHIYSSVK